MEMRRKTIATKTNPIELAILKHPFIFRINIIHEHLEFTTELCFRSFIRSLLFQSTQLQCCRAGFHESSLTAYRMRYVLSVCVLKIYRNSMVIYSIARQMSQIEAQNEHSIRFMHFDVRP